MRAIQIDRFGGPAVLEVREVPDPVPAAGELLVRTIASSINPVDVKTRSRVYETGIPPLPMTLGWDLAGVVADPGTTGLRPGQRVIAMSPQLAAGAGTWADLVALPAGLVAPAPVTVSLGEAATLPLAGLTAWQALDWLRLREGDRLLVTGGAGAVGGFVLQIARHRGMAVDALVHPGPHARAAMKLGALRALTSPAEVPVRGYDGVLDTIGAPVADGVRDGGRYASVATENGPLPELAHRGIAATMVHIQPAGAVLAELARLVDAGALRLRADSLFPVSAARGAHERFAQGKLNGKVVLMF